MDTVFVIGTPEGLDGYFKTTEMMQWLVDNAGPEHREKRNLKYMVDNTEIFTSDAIMYEDQGDDLVTYMRLNHASIAHLMKQEYEALDYGWSIIKVYEGSGWMRVDQCNTTSLLEPLQSIFTVHDETIAIMFKIMYSELIFASYNTKTFADQIK